MTQIDRRAPERQDSFVAAIRDALLQMTRMADHLAPYCDAQDVVQDAVERAWRERSTYDPERGNPTAWLLTITAAVARDAHRRTARRHRLFRTTPPVPPDRPEPSPDVDLERAVQGLARRQRLAVTCFYLLDLSVTDTARVMGCSEGTVKSTLSDARRALRERLGESE